MKSRWPWLLACVALLVLGWWLLDSREAQHADGTEHGAKDTHGGGPLLKGTQPDEAQTPAAPVESSDAETETAADAEPQGFVLTGTVTREDGRPSSGVLIRVQRKGVKTWERWASGNLHERRVDRRGKFRLELPFEDLSAHWVYAYPKKDDGPRPAFVDGADVQSAVPIELHMRSSPVLDIEVRDEAGRPVPGAHLVVTPAGRYGPTHPEPGEPAFKWRYTTLGATENSWRVVVPHDGALRVQARARGFVTSIQAVAPDDERVVIVMRPPNGRIVVRLQEAERHRNVAFRVGPDDPRLGDIFAGPHRVSIKDGVGEVAVAAPGRYAIRVSAHMRQVEIVRGIEVTAEQPEREVVVSLRPSHQLGSVRATGWLDRFPWGRVFGGPVGKGFKAWMGESSHVDRDIELAKLPGRYDFCLVAPSATHVAVWNDVEFRGGETQSFIPEPIPASDFRSIGEPSERIGAGHFWIVTGRGLRVPALVHGNARGSGGWLIYGIATWLPVGKNSLFRVPGEEATLHWRTKEGKKHSVKLERVMDK